MKRILYNTYVKFTAFLLCAACVASGAYLVTSTFFKEDIGYFFENSYEDSHMAGMQLYDEMVRILNALEDTVDDDGHIYPDKVRIAYPLPDEWEYYIKVNGKEYSNIKGVSYEDFKGSPIAFGVRSITDKTPQPTPHPTARPSDYVGDRETLVEEPAEFDRSQRTGFSNSAYHSYWFIDGAEDDYEVCVRMPKNRIEEARVVWESEKYDGDSCAMKVIILLILAAALFVYLLCVTGKRYGTKEIQQMLIDKMFVEITAALIAAIIAGGVLVFIGAAYFIIEEKIQLANVLVMPAVFAVVSLLLLTVLSLIRNLRNKTFLKRSIIARLIQFVWKYLKKICGFLWGLLKRICRGIKNICSDFKKAVLAIGAEHFSGKYVGSLVVGFAVAIVILTALCFANAGFVIILAAFTAAAFVFVVKRLIGFNELKEGIEKIKDGDMSHKIENCPDGVIGQMAENINSIGDGMQKSLEREVKAERMKSELITNVSHDLKTPLTSIINYADLLSKETLTPPMANDYVKIIKQKSERLKQLTSDLFDISKVQSGNEKFNFEDIDLCLLVNQAMAELNESIKQSGLIFKFTSSDKEVFVRADGRKMSRVFENLLVNCIKYAMKNTRVYITVSKNESGAVVEIKNIAGYEMDFDAEEIAERFVRGDSARSTEGSGLGLAIVKSYVEGCGGSVEITADGDLFKVTIRF